MYVYMYECKRVCTWIHRCMRVTQHNELDFTFSFENGIAEWGGPWHTSHTETRCSQSKRERERERKERQRERVDRGERERERERERVTRERERRIIFFATNITSYRYHTCIANIRDSNRTLEDDVCTYICRYLSFFCFFSSTREKGYNLSTCYLQRNTVRSIKGKLLSSLNNGIVL